MQAFAEFNLPSAIWPVTGVTTVVLGWSYFSVIKALKVLGDQKQKSNGFVKVNCENRNKQTEGGMVGRFCITTLRHNKDD